MSQATGSKLNLPTRLIIGVIGVVAMVSGFRRCSTGLGEISSAVDFEGVVTAMNAQVDSGNMAMFAAQPLLLTLVNDFNKLGLPAMRQQDTAQARKAHDLFGQSSAHFRNAAKLGGVAAGKDDRVTMKAIWPLKLTSYNGLSDVEAINQHIAGLLRDESAMSAKALMDSVLSCARQRDSLQLGAINAQAQAEAATAASKK